MSIRLPVPKSTDEGATDAMVEKVKTALAKEFPGASFSNYSTVSGKVSGELIQNGLLAVFLAIVGIAIFSWFRYEWQFGVSTAVAVIHDVLMAVGFFAITGMVFDLNIVAAVLTIIGYSINDKMVIDDRIRENMRKYRKMDMKALIDLSVNETLPRTVMTSLHDHAGAGRTAHLRRPCAARLHGGDDARHRGRHLFVDLRLVLAADLARPQAEPDAQEGGQGLRGRRRAHRSAQSRPKARPGRPPMDLRREEMPGGRSITGFAGRGFRVGERVYRRGLLIDPAGVAEWAAPSRCRGARSSPCWARCSSMDPLPEFLLLGTGRATGAAAAVRSCARWRNGASASRRWTAAPRRAPGACCALEERQIVGRFLPALT